MPKSVSEISNEIRALSPDEKADLLRLLKYCADSHSQVVYAVLQDLIYVVAVAHGNREPGYWISRVQDG